MQNAFRQGGIPVLLLIDNYDSFTYNLYQYLAQLGQEVLVCRNDESGLGSIEALNPDRIVVSPGPSTPLNAGISNEVIRRFGPTTPVLGVCLGHQCIGYAYGADIIRAKEVRHGKASQVYHSGSGVFKDLPSPFSAIRYHSLAINPDTLPECLEVTARCEDRTIMGIKHRLFPVHGIQFHPESFMTDYGMQLLENFLCGEVVQK